MTNPSRIVVENYPMYDPALGRDHGVMCFYTGEARRHPWASKMHELLMDGRGIARMPGGDVYEGDCRLGMFEGLGVMRYASGDLYDGQWASHLRHGYGVMEMADGGSFSGLFRFGERDGAGASVSGDGGSYSGSFAQGRASGLGRLTLPSGEVIDGEFRDGQPHGTCTVSYASGDTEVAVFARGERHGRCRYKVSTTGDTFIADYVDGVRQGATNQCRILYASGDEYLGEWRTDNSHADAGRGGVPHGEGTMVGRDGSVFRGAFHEGLREGFGVLTLPPGAPMRSYEGEFHSGLFDGRATVHLSDGSVAEQFFSKGVAHGLAHLSTADDRLKSLIFAPGEDPAAPDYHMRAVL